MKVGVYNLYWTTFGGGEQMACAAVDALCRDHDVELLGPETLDLDEARERLGVRLEGVSFRRVASDGLAATVASADYDLFVNHTYRSTAPSLARYGLYFVMFPHVLDEGGPRRSIQHAGRTLAGSARVLGGVADRNGATVVEGPFIVQVEPDAKRVSVRLRADHPEEVVVTQVAAGARPQHVRVAPTAQIDLELEDDLGETHLGQVIVSPVLLADDRPRARRLVLTGLRVDERAVNPSPLAFRQRLLPARQADFLRTYQRVVANSEYTRRWSLERWGRGDDVISPPVRMRQAGDKEQMIVSIGRFFGEESGHSKRQLDLVRAFRAMVDQGLDGWRLVLIGGCSAKDRDYAMAVRREAAGLPVDVRLSAPGAVVDAHLAAASIYWHGAGFGSDLQAHPDRAEHFGIAPIEAMSAGAVPVVFDAGGPAAVVRDGLDGLRWTTLDELAAHTRRLIDDPGLRARLAAAAATRAREFDVEHCEERVREVVAGMVDQER